MLVYRLGVQNGCHKRMMNESMKAKSSQSPTPLKFYNDDICLTFFNCRSQSRYQQRSIAVSQFKDEEIVALIDGFLAEK